MAEEKSVEASKEPTIPKVQYKDKDASSSSISPCIFRTPFPGLQFQDPQLVSIGPYHNTKTLPLQQYKYFFLDKFISRTKDKGKDLHFYVQKMISLESRTIRCYSEDLSMSSSPDFVEMMLLDGCFIMEALVHFGKSEKSEDWVFPIEPWQLPILVRDLLILENQIPFFVLEMLFESLAAAPTVSLCTMALKFFDLAFPRSTDISCEFNHMEPDHLLDLFLNSIRPSDPPRDLNPSHFYMRVMVIPKFVYSFARSQSPIAMRDYYEQQCDPAPPFYLTKNVMELQASGIELRPKIAARFTDIDFNNGVLEIPSIAIDDLFIAILINCVAFEHCSKKCSKDLSAYVSFMSRLIKRTSDVELLYSNGIISRFSHDDQRVVESFHMLWINSLDLDFQHSYLPNRLKELECYYTRDGETRRCQRHVLRYWRLSFFCVTNLLFGFNRLRSVFNLMIPFVQQVKFNGIHAEFQGDITCPQDRSSVICDSVFAIVQFLYNSARGRVKSIDLGFDKFMAFFFLIIVIIMLVVCENIPAPTFTVDEQDLEVEDSVTVDEQVEDSVSIEDHDLEVEDSVTVDEQIEDSASIEDQHVEVEDSVTVDEQVEDSVSIEDQHVEVENSVTVDEQVEDSVSIEDQHVDVEGSVTVDEQVEDSVSIEDQHLEVEDSVTVDEKVEDSVSIEDQHIEVEDSVTVDEMIVDCVSKDLESNVEYYSEPWTRILEHKEFRMLVSALRVA